jgi:hypothetical protein
MRTALSTKSSRGRPPLQTGNATCDTRLELVAGGGLELSIYKNVQLDFCSRTSTLILLVYALVLTSDWIGGTTSLEGRMNKGINLAQAQ